MSRFFRSEAPLWRGIARLTDVLALSLMWVFLSLPLITLGAATSALYDAAVKHTIPGESGAIKQFFKTFRQEFKTAALATLLWGGLCAALTLVVWSIRAHIVFEGAAAVMVLALWYAVLILPIGALCWMFPLLSRFTFTVKALISTALRITIGHLPQTILISLSSIAAVILSEWLLAPVLALPCLTVMFWSVVMERVFGKYTPGS